MSERDLILAEIADRELALVDARALAAWAERCPVLCRRRARAALSGPGVDGLHRFLDEAEDCEQDLQREIARLREELQERAA